MEKEQEGLEPIGHCSQCDGPIYDDEKDYDCICYMCHETMI
jgi:hypothetical protein